MAQSITPVVLEQWILQSNDPSQPALQWQATQYLREWTANTNTIPILQSLIQQSAHEMVKFYALTSLARLPLSERDRRALREQLLQWPHHSMTNAIRNKVALILSRFVWEDVPHAWGTYEADLLRAPAALFLKTVDTMLEELTTAPADDDESRVLESASSVSFATKKATRRVKDFLKGYISVNGETVETHQAKLCPVETLFAHTVKSLEESVHDVNLLALALSTLRHFFLWTDVTSLRPNHQDPPRVLHLLLQLTLHNAPDIQVATWQVWRVWSTSAQALVADVDESVWWRQGKVPVYTTLLEHVHKTNLIPYHGESELSIEVVIEVASLIASLGVEVLSRKPSHDDELVGKVLDLFFRAFAYDDIDVATAVIPLAQKLATHMEEDKAARKHLPQILNSLYEQLKYPSDFGYDHENEDDAEEIVFRGELSKLFTRLVRTAPDTCLQFVCEAASHQSGGPLSEIDTPNIEALLRLVFHYCEGIRPPPGLKTLLEGSGNSAAFCELLVAFHQSDIANHPSPVVILLYFETAVRYYPIFHPSHNTADPDLLLSKVLGALTGSQGLQHANGRVRSRCCYLLLRLVKAIVHLLRPFVETAIDGINGLIASNLGLRADDTLYLFETMGLLLARGGLPLSKQCSYLTQLISPHVQSIQNRLVLSGEDPSLQLSQSIAALGHLIMPFSVKVDSHLKTLLLDMLQVAMSVLSAFPASDAVRNKTMILLQRLILCAGKLIIPKLLPFLTILVASCEETDVVFVSQLMVQICVKFNTEAAVLIDASLVPFMERCRNLVLAMAVPPVNGTESGALPHTKAEELAVQKPLFLFLQHVVSYKLSCVFVSNTNLPHLGTVLQTMCHGAVEIRNPSVQRTCVKFFGDLFQEWVVNADGNGGQLQSYSSGFVSFCAQQFIPQTFTRYLLQASFDPHDAQQARFLVDFTSVLVQVQRVLSKTECESMYNQIFQNAASLPAVAALAKAVGAKDGQKKLRALLQHVKDGGDIRSDVLC